MTDWTSTLFPIVTAAIAGWILHGWRGAVAAALLLVTLRSEMKP